MLIEKKCKICRKVGQKVLLNERCASGKCALDRRRKKPGMHPQKRRPLSQYGKELLEKQKLRYSYLLKEKQIKNLAKKALRSKEPAPSALIKMLERKFSNVIWLLGLAPSKTTAKQFISHGHFFVNGKRIKSHSYFVEPGDTIEIREQSKEIKTLKDTADRLRKYAPPAWLKIDPQTLKAEVLRSPELEEINSPINLNLVIDFYSRH